MPIRIAKIKNIGSGKYWWGCGETGLLMHHWWAFKIVQSSWKRLATSWKKLNMQLPYLVGSEPGTIGCFLIGFPEMPPNEKLLSQWWWFWDSKVKHLLDAQSHKACMDFRPAFSYILVSKLLPTCKERTLWLQDCKMGEWWCLGKGSHLSGILGCLPPALVTRPLAKKTPLAKPPLPQYFPVTHVSRVFIFPFKLYFTPSSSITSSLSDRCMQIFYLSN